VSDFARHQELERVFRAGVGGEVDQAFVHDLRACFPAMLLRRSTSSSPVTLR
jgi:hypothetical protein